MTSYSYSQAMKLYKEDINNLGRVFFQQDNALYHNSKKIIEYIDEIPKKLEFWPPNSPDLFPIEELWDILEDKQQHYNFSKY